MKTLSRRFRAVAATRQNHVSKSILGVYAAYLKELKLYMFIAVSDIQTEVGPIYRQLEDSDISSCLETRQNITQTRIYVPKHCKIVQTTLLQFIIVLVWFKIILPILNILKASLSSTNA